MPNGANAQTSLKNLLSTPITWENWSTQPDILSFLSDLQANILKGHGRDHTANIFVSFEDMKPSAIATILNDLSFLTTSALEQLRAAAAFKASHVSGGRVLCTFLAASAYAKLGATVKAPVDAAFAAGMRGRGQLPKITFDINGNPVPLAGLNDPDSSTWERDGAWDPVKPAPDAMILIADDKAELVSSGVASLKNMLRAAGARVLGVDVGLAQRRKQTGGDPKGEGVEQFGYVDGRSQPLFLAEDIAANKATEKAIADKAHHQWPQWDESFPPAQFIVPDASGKTAFSCGSFFVYRKLEQNVEAFKRRESQLADWMGLDEEDRERAGALVVGRFEDGTPVAVSGSELGGHPTNNFSYDGKQKNGIELCPFKGHIRKTNPRTSDTTKNADERRRIMARRGITFGDRAPRTIDDDFPEDDLPSAGVGLLFMAYMKDITNQFEFTQAAWAGNNDFQKPETGIDAVIGQRPNRHDKKDINWADGYSGKAADFDFKTAVRLIGGDYFFAPAISFLQTVS